MTIRIRTKQLIRLLRRIKKKGDIYYIDATQLGLPKTVVKEINSILIKNK